MYIKQFFDFHQMLYSLKSWIFELNLSYNQYQRDFKLLRALFMIKNKIHTSIIVTLFAAMSCTPLPTNSPSIQEPVVKTISSIVKKSNSQKEYSTVHFSISLTPAQFKLMQTVNATHIKLTITDGTSTIFANGADGNGFNTVGGQNPIALTANVPTGTNWFASVGLYSNATDGGLIQDFKTAFDSPAPGTIEINLRTHLMGEIIRELQKLNSTKLTGNDLNAYQAFIDTLVGFTAPSTFVTEPRTLSALQLAALINNGTIDPVNAATAGGLTASDYLITPFVRASYRAPQVNGLLPPALNSNNNSLFFLNGGGSILSLTGAIGDNGTPADISDDTLTESFAPNNTFVASSTQHIGTSTISLGLAPGNVPVMYFLDETSGNTEVLKAVRQSDGSTVEWNFNFGGNTSLLNTYFTPVLQRDEGGPGTADDTDIVYAYLNAANVGDKGIYAVKNGTQQWFYNTGNREISNLGALSADGQTLYVIQRGELPFAGLIARLMAINTTNGTLRWDRTFDNLGNDQGMLSFDSGPALGTDGTIYVNTYHFSQDSGYIHSVNPATGAINWSRTLSHKSVKSPVISRENGKDVIYSVTNEGKLHAVYDDNTLKWAAPVYIGSPISADPISVPIIGEEPDGRDVVFIGMGDSKVYAVRDMGTSGELAWGISPGGTFNGGFSLKDNLLYLATNNGGDGQFILLQAFKVFAANYPSDAPWPKIAGNFENSGRRPQDQP